VYRVEAAAKASYDALMSRTTPTSADLMPEVLELLKRRRELKKEEVAKHMRNWMRERGFDDRDRSIGWALNRLEKEHYVARPRRGIWQITDRGLATTLTTAESINIVANWTQRECEARAPRRASRPAEWAVSNKTKSPRCD
jgi:restriction endonuclease Mrr